MLILTNDDAQSTRSLITRLERELITARDRLETAKQYGEPTKAKATKVALLETQLDVLRRVLAAAY